MNTLFIFLFCLQLPGYPDTQFQVRKNNSTLTHAHLITENFPQG